MGRILLVEDTALVVKAITRLLQQAGHDIVTAERGDTGLALAISGAFDLAILDIWVPGINGLDLLRRLKEQQPQLPVLIISGGGAQPLETSTALAQVIGAAEVLFKPIEADVLLSAVARALGNTSPSA
jgi:two-component system, chemotaxis family, chemotaxis protein CheY